jgi:hypothetical protein
LSLTPIFHPAPTTPAIPSTLSHPTFLRRRIDPK